MRHITADTLVQDNNTYREFLEPNGWAMEEGDYLINKFVGSGKRTGTTSADNTMPLLRDGSTIWIDPIAIKGVEGIDITNSTLGRPWRIKNVRVRIIPSAQLYGKGNPSSSYAPVRLFGPEFFDCDLRSVQFPADDLSDTGCLPMYFSADGVLKNMIIQFSADGPTPYVKFKGWGAGGGGFAGLRLFESAVHRVVSGEVTHFVVKDTRSESMYIGSIKPVHTKFRHFLLGNGLLINAGSEALQLQNFGEGCVVEDITILHTGTEWISPFQNFQRGTLQIKAGGGSFKVRRIYVCGYGGPAVILFSAGTYTDPNTGNIYEGVKPGDKIELTDLYFTDGNGPLLQVDKSNVHGAEWVFDNVHVGMAHGRAETDTNSKLNYAYLNDVFTATDKVTFRSITTDTALPLVGKYGKYEILDHRVVNEVVRPTYDRAPFKRDEQVMGYYHTYNQVSQTQFYPTAGEPVKYRKGDIVYYDVSGKPRTWFKSLADQLGNEGSPGDGWEQLFWDDAGVRSDSEGFGVPSTSQPTTKFKQSGDSPLLGVAGFQQSIEDKNKITMQLSEIILELQKIEGLHKAEIEELKLQLSSALSQLAPLVDTVNSLEAKIESIRAILNG
jgi:hypothetical protein